MSNIEEYIQDAVESFAEALHANNIYVDSTILNYFELLLRRRVMKSSVKSDNILLG